MDHATIIESLRRSTFNVCSMTLGVDVSIGQAYESAQSTCTSQGVVALVGLAGDWVGTGCLSCAPDVACKLAGRFMSQPWDIVNDEVMDAMGELATIVIGNFRDDMEPYTGTLSSTMPTVVFGRNFTARSASGTQWTVLPVVYENSILEVKVCLYRQVTRAQKAGDAAKFVPTVH